MIGATAPRGRCRRSGRCSSPADGRRSTGIDLDRRAVRRPQAHRARGSATDGDAACTSRASSARTLVYKGMLTTPQLRRVLPRPRATSGSSRALALVHSPVLHQHVPVVAAGPPVPLRRPQRRDQHGAGQPQLDAGPRGAARRATCSPATSSASSRSARPGASDTASFDEALELLHLGGRSLPHAVLMMIPEAWENHESMDPAKRAFYRFHAVADGAVGRPRVDRVHRRHGHRRGARPQRPAPAPLLGHRRRPAWSWRREVGVLDIDPRDGRARRAACSRAACSWSTPPRAASSATTRSRPTLAAEQPYQRVARRRPRRTSTTCPTACPRAAAARSRRAAASRRSATRTRSCKILIAPMARTGAEPLGSMGTDTPIAVLSDRSRLLFDYFKQLFAQVTNPPLDAIREELVTSLGGTIGPEGNLLDPGPAVVPADRAARSRSSTTTSWPSSSTSTTTATCRASSRSSIYVPVPGRPRAATACARRSTACGAEVVRGHRRRRQASSCCPTATRRASWRRSRRCCSRRRCTTTSSARRPARRSASSSRPATPARCTTWRCCSGYGAGGHQPVPRVRDDRGPDRRRALDRRHRLRQGRRRTTSRPRGKGVLKVMSKMGISTVASLHRRAGLRGDRPRPGARRRVLHRHRQPRSAASASTSSPTRSRPATAAPTPTGPSERAHRDLEVGGEYQWRREGEYHLFNPETVFKLQHATRAERYDVFKEYTQLVDDQAAQLATLRGPVQLHATASARRSRSTRSSRSARSSSASPPAR